MFKFQKERFIKTKKWFFTLLLGAALTALLLRFDFAYLENSLYRFRLIYSHSHPQSISRAPQWINVGITWLITTSVIEWILYSQPFYAVTATLAITLTLIAFCQLLFESSGILLKESYPLLGILISHYLFVPYRLIREYKRRWDLQKRTQLIAQIEEMKSNFISLITHDLKTPIARIQGLTTSLLNSKQSPLSTCSTQTIHQILAATDELDHFVSRILELNRVESNQLQLRLQSKDVNRLLEQTVSRFKEASQIKGVKIKLSLDPLFPIQMDPELMGKVFSNILDNALKYSPQNSIIEIQSKEDSNWVVVKITDQGIGMSKEERSQVFTRFFRAKNDATALVRGTGLGLYLSKFFVEMHRGRLELTSSAGEGSTFTIYLPLHTPPQRIPFFNNPAQENSYV